jgi:Ig-like domain CHU_C associated/Secretion system C-terminal sorting domain
MNKFLFNSTVFTLFYLVVFYFHISAQTTSYSACNGKTVAISGAQGQTIKLFQQAIGGIALGTGLSVTTPVLTASKTFYIEDAANASLPRVPVYVAVNPLPSATVTSSNSAFCLGGSSLLTANPSSSIENKIGFTGAYGISNSAIKNSNTNGGINTVFFPDSLVLISSGDNGSGNPGFSEYAFKANATGTVQFNWHFTCLDGSIYDYPTIAVNNGAFTYFNGYALSSSIKKQSGSHVQLVNAGDTVRLRIETVDNLFAEGKCVISGFIAPIPATVTIDWYSSVLGGSSLGTGITYSAIPVSAGSKNYYAESVSTNGCSGVRTLTNINVFALPVFTVSGPLSICPGQTVTLNAIGNNTFSWSNGVINGQAFVPLNTQTYKVIATTSNGCKDSAFKTVAINPTPNVTINSSSATGIVCAGTSVTLSGGGANTYSWTGGILDGVPFTPTTTTNYIVTATDLNGCSNSMAQLITVNSLPTITINSIPASGLVCAGAPVTLTASGASTYAWTGGITNAQAFTPTSTVAYTVTATDANGCIKTASKTISITSLPVLSITAVPANATVCSGSNISLFGNGASTYTWSGGITNGTAFSPTATATYVLTGTGANGCSATLNQTVNVRSLPIVSVNVLPANATVCGGSTVTLTGSGANTYVWSGGVNNGIPFFPSSTTTYFLTATDSNVCSSTVTKTITVNPSPAITISSNPVNGITCSGSLVTLTGTGANTYAWNNGISNGVPFVSTNSGNYVLTATGNNGCVSKDSIFIFVESPLNFATTVSNTTITAIQSGASYQWINCTTNSVIANQTNQSYTATQNGSYAVIVSKGACSDTSACVSISNIGLKSIDNPTASVLMYPNPSNGVFILESQNEMEVELINELGQKLKAIKLNIGNNNFDFIALPSGIYYLKGKDFNQKMIIFK